MDALGDLAQQGAGDGLVGRVVLEVDGDEELLSLLVDITDIDTTLVGEEDPITLDRELALGSGCDWQSGAVAERQSRAARLGVK